MIENQSINRAIDYILAHINEPIGVDAISAHCNFSKYHFSRLFRAETGESVYEFVKRVRLEQSAFRLKIEQDRSITDIGCEYGYSASNYSSAFKQHYDIPPVDFRRGILEKSTVNPIFHNTDIHPETYEQVQSKITIETLPDYHVVYARHKGSYKDLPTHWAQFLKDYEAYRTDDALLIECTYDDPVITNEDSCLYDLYMTVPEGFLPGRTCMLKGGKFAIYHFDGSVHQIYHALQSIFTIWLPQSGHAIDERYGFDIYREINCDAMNMKIDICIPIK